MERIYSLRFGGQAKSQRVEDEIPLTPRTPGMLHGASGFMTEGEFVVD